MARRRRATQAEIDAFLEDMAREFGVLPEDDSSDSAIDWKPRKENKPQRMAYDCEADRLFYGGAAGGGKGGICHSIQWAIDNLDSFTVDDYQDIMSQIPDAVRDMDSKVLMWNGQWKSFAEIAAGDRIMNPDGQAQSVLQVFDRGQQQSYRVTFEDGTFVDCDADHLWSVWKARTNTRRKTCSGRKVVENSSTPVGWNINYIQRVMVRDTRWVLEEVGKGARLIIPISAELNFTQLHRGRADRAYLYGALLGDGSIQTHRFGGSGIRLSSADEWVIERCTSVLEKWFRYDYEGKAASVVIRDLWVDQWARNSGLIGTHSHTKFLPDGYLKESLCFRWALAQGLFDTDGYAAKSSNEVSYCTVSPALAEGVANLVRSLGFMAKIREKQGICYSKGFAKDGRIAYIVSVEGNGRWKLFSLPRKIEMAKATEPKIWVGKTIVRVEPIGKIYSRCIKVSNPNGLYITDGYNVTHNSDLLLGLAFTAHHDSIIFRREYPQLKALIKRSKEIAAGQGRYNNTEKVWTGLPGSKTIEFGAVQYEDDKEKYQGRPHDLVGFDELTHFTRTQFDFLTGWNRSTRPGQRCRIVATGNPPTTPEGQWVIEYWAPWLDNDHPLYPYPPGELLWFITVSEEDRIVEGPEPVEIDGEIYRPHSRTFIPASLQDNPDLAGTNYASVLQAMPEPLRSQMLYGSFDITPEDDPWQVIPTAWVEAAMNRQPLEDLGLSALGVDVARGGRDETIIAPKYGDTYKELVTFPGQSTPDGSMVAAQVVQHYQQNAHVFIDVVGVGGSVYDALSGSYPGFIHAVGGGEAAQDAYGQRYTDGSGQLEFKNLRSWMIWRFRELLNPKTSKVVLPADSKLRADLCAPRWKLTPPISGSTAKGRIQVESKDDIKKRIGRSPDRGDAVIYASLPPEHYRQITGNISTGVPAIW